MINRLIKIVSASLLLSVGICFFCLVSLLCKEIVGDYSSEPVYEVDARQVQPEYEGKLVRMRGVVEEKLPGEGWRARLGAYELRHGGGGFASMYTRQNHPAIGSEVFLVGWQHGNRIQVFHHFEGCYLAWMLCTHQLVIYAGGVLNTGHKILGVVGLYVLGQLCFWGMWRCGGMRPSLRLRLTICAGLPLLLYLAALCYNGFIINKYVYIASLQWTPILCMGAALLLPTLIGLRYGESGITLLITHLTPSLLKREKTSNRRTSATPMNKWFNKLAVWALGTLMVLLTPLYALGSVTQTAWVGACVRNYVSDHPIYYRGTLACGLTLCVGTLFVFGLQLLCAKLMGRLGCENAVGLLRGCGYVVPVLFVPGCTLSLADLRPAEVPYMPLMIVVGFCFALLPFLLCRKKNGAIIRWTERNNIVNNLSE